MKIIFNDAFWFKLRFDKKFSDDYGSQAVVLRANILSLGKNYKILDHKNLKIIDDNIDSFFEKLNKINASEISLIITNLDGSFNGPDLNLINQVKNLTDRHIVYSGGISKISDFKDCFNAGANAVITNNFFIRKI